MSLRQACVFCNSLALIRILNNLRISKTYHQFRQLSKRFRDAADLATAGIESSKDLSKSASYVVRFADAFTKLIDSEPVEYVAKVSLRYVKKLAKERSARLDGALEMIIQNFPPDEFRDGKGVSQLIRDIETFFWSDHVVEEGKKFLTTSRVKVNLIILCQRHPREKTASHRLPHH